MTHTCLIVSCKHVYDYNFTTVGKTFTAEYQRSHLSRVKRKNTQHVRVACFTQAFQMRKRLRCNSINQNIIFI